MIMAFDQIAGGTAMGKAEQLAGGIGVALLTTAGGLTVAIPSLILYMYLSGRVDILVMEMDAPGAEGGGLDFRRGACRTSRGGPFAAETRQRYRHRRIRLSESSSAHQSHPPGIDAGE